VRTDLPLIGRADYVHQDLVFLADLVNPMRKAGTRRLVKQTVRLLICWQRRSVGLCLVLFQYGGNQRVEVSGGDYFLAKPTENLRLPLPFNLFKTNLAHIMATR
jgi:hypothetical protein